VERPRLQGARRQGREIQIGFVLTGISSQKAVIIRGTATRTVNIACVKKWQLPPFFEVHLLHLPGETEDNHGRPQVQSYFLFMFHFRMLSVAQNE